MLAPHRLRWRAPGAAASAAVGRLPLCSRSHALPCVLLKRYGLQVLSGPKSRFDITVAEDSRFIVLELAQILPLVVPVRYALADRLKPLGVLLEILGVLYRDLGLLPSVIFGMPGLGEEPMPTEGRAHQHDEPERPGNGRK